MRRKGKSKFLALLLVCVMVLGTTGTAVFAEGTEEDDYIIVPVAEEEEYSETTEGETDDVVEEFSIEAETGDIIDNEINAETETEDVGASVNGENESEAEAKEGDASIASYSVDAQFEAEEAVTYSASDEEYGIMTMATVSGSGTQTDPWQVGASSEDSVTAYLSDDGTTLYIQGTGAMADGSGGNTAWPWQDGNQNNGLYITKAVIGDKVTYIGQYCFQNCTSLISVEISSTVTAIGDRVFYGCSALTSVTIPKTVNSIGKYAFSISGITSITIPDGVTEIADYTFQDCSDLKSVEIPDAVTRIGINAFDGCKSLEEIELPEDLTELGAYAFRNCSSLKSITLPVGINAVDQYTFRSCTSLEEVIAKGTITSIGTCAFHSCTNLKNVFDLSQADNLNATYMFYNCSSLEGPLDLSSMTEIYDNTFYDCKSLVSVTFSEELTAIDKYAFQNCTSLTSVDFPDTLTSIKERAFSGCTELIEIELPESLKTIGDYAFYNCPLNGESMEAETSADAGAVVYSLKNNETETIKEDKTYEGKTLVIPAAVTSIGTSAFENSKVEVFVVGNNITDVAGLEFASTALSAIIFDNFQSWVSVDSESNLKKHTSKDVELVYLLGLDDNGIYLNGVNGDDQTGVGTVDSPVKTFAKAKALAEENETQYIYVTGTITVNDKEEWDGSVDGSESNLTLLRINGDSNMVNVVGTNADLILKNITINGRNVSSTASMISVTGGGSLNIEDGAVIQKNLRSSSAGGNMSDDHAAVMVRNGNLVLDGGIIRDNTNGHFGGAVALIAQNASEKVTMDFESGTISGSDADYGGGIYMYGDATLNMSGGTVTGNKATDCGGGIFVGPDATATISAGYITENRQTTSYETYGGGGIYVESSEGAKRSDGTGREPGQLYLYNVEITGNYCTSTRWGDYIATIGCCQTGNVDINITKGAVIHDNQEYETVYVARNDSSGSFTLPAIMLGGGAYNWSTTSGMLIDLDDLAKDNTSTVQAVTYVSTEDGTVTGRDRCTTFITDNYAFVMGSAIGTNGNVTIGYNDGDVSIDIKKNWNEAGNADVKPYEVLIYVYATDGYGEITCIGSVTLNEENNWKATICELPKYDSDGLEYTYSVKEAPAEGWMSDVTGGKTETSTPTGGNYDTDAEKTAEYEFTITNTAARELSISKEIYGDSDEDTYEFKIELKKNDEPYTGDINATYFMTQDNDEVMADRTGMIAFENGVGSVNIQAGETVTLEVGYGMSWTVTEVTQSADETYVVVNGIETKATAASGTVTDSSEVIFINSYREYFDLDEEIIPDGDDDEHRDTWEARESVTEYGAIELEMSTYLPVIEPEEVKDGEITMLFHNKLDEGLKLDAEEEDDLHITIGGVKIPAEYYTIDVFEEENDRWTINPLALTDGDNDECTFHVTVDLTRLYNETDIVTDEDLTGETEIIIYFYVDLEGRGMDGTYVSTVQYQIFDADELLYTSSESVVYLYTCDININKYDTETGDPLEGATFGIYYDEECTQPVMRNGEDYTEISDEEGIVSFYGLAAGTYYIKELEAPDGYILSMDVLLVELGDDDSDNDDSGYILYETEFGNTPEPILTDDETEPTLDDTSEPEPADDGTEPASPDDETEAAQNGGIAAGESASETSAETAVVTNSADTGDNSSPLLWVMMLCCSAACIAGLAFVSIRSRARR